MQTRFSSDLLAEATTREADAILRRCVHCGFCNATCPTYRVKGDELDGPRGRIYLLKNLLESPDDTPGKDVVKHLDRCLGCQSCTTTCPADVDYLRLLDIGRARLAQSSGAFDIRRLLRKSLISLLLRPRLFRAFLFTGALVDRLFPWLPEPLRAMTRMARAVPEPYRRRAHHTTTTGRTKVILLKGCVQQAAGRHINEAARNLLRRAGREVLEFKSARCCGALPQHLGEEKQARQLVSKNLRVWESTLEKGCDAVLVAASGCTGILSEYHYLVSENPHLLNLAEKLAGCAADIGDYLNQCGLQFQAPEQDLPTMAWHAPCSLKHGVRADRQVVDLLYRAGFTVQEPSDSHLCCGAAGTYSIFQPQISGQLGRNKVERLEAAAPGALVSANLGCMMQLKLYSSRPVVHYLELLDWASGGEKPRALNGLTA